MTIMAGTLYEGLIRCIGSCVCVCAFVCEASHKCDLRGRAGGPVRQQMRWLCIGGELQTDFMRGMYRWLEVSRTSA